MGKYTEIKLGTVQFCLKGTHSGKRICIIPFAGEEEGTLFLFSGLLIKQIHRALLCNILIPLFTNHFHMHLILIRTA